jgi:hypothetical protein
MSASHPLTVPAILAFLLVPGAALADPPKKDANAEAAKALFYDARTLMQAGKFAEACPKLEETVRLDPGIGSEFNLADCNEHLGKLATAWAAFQDVAARSKQANQPDREKVARKRAAALEPRVPKLIVTVNNAPSGLEVKRDGVVVGAPVWGTPVPIDPGTHRISATAPGRETFETTIAATESNVARVSIPELPASAVAMGPARAPGTATPAVVQPPPTNASNVPPAASVAPDFPQPIVETPGATQRTIGWVVTVVGAASVGVGSGFGLASMAKRNESRSHCGATGCDGDGLRLRDDAMRNGNISTVTMIAGAGAIAGGLLLVLTAPRDAAPADRAGKLRAIPTATVAGGGLMLQGAFQ